MNRFIQKALCAVAACALALSLSACGSTSPATGAASADVPTVTIWGYGGQEVREALQAVADAHNADPAYNTKARVEIQFVVSGTSEQSLPDRLAAAYQAGETDTDFDIIALNSVYTRLSQNSTPNSNATNLHCCQKRCCSFGISSSNASPAFQVQKSIFHQMTKPIQVTVILPLLLAISLSWNDDIHSSISGISNDLIGVIPTIGQ